MWLCRKETKPPFLQEAACWISNLMLHSQLDGSLVSVQPYLIRIKTLKNCAYRHIMFGKYVIDTPKQFAEHAVKAVKCITSLYFPAEDVLVEPDNIGASSRIKDTFHMIKQFCNEQNAPYLQLFKMAPDEKTFFTQFYGEGACGHQKFLMMITIVVHALETLNQLKNGFSAQYVRFGSISAVFLIDNGR